jgi:3D-(3,5/4)-trihydroxycyclohexane-1,2-dione acylhydrolase (decyclizing)
MAPTEITTSVQEGVKIIIVLVDNGGFASIGSLSRSLGQGGFGTSYRARNEKSGQLDGETLKVDFVANARSLGAHAIKAATLDELKNALKEAKAMDRTTVIVVETDATASVPGYDSWWDVAVAEVSEMESVREARVRYEEARKRERYFV